jgi:protein-tyrosine phosphatase
MKMTRVLFVCLGNICRSPLAQGVFEKLVNDAGLSDQFEVDSAGTASYHVGNRPHHGSQRVAVSHDISIDEQRSRQLKPSDYETFDWLIAMDESNLNHMRKAAPHLEDRIQLLLDFADHDEKEVHDPFYDDNFARTYHQVEAGCRSFLEYLIKPHKTP